MDYKKRPLQNILPSATRNPFYKRGSWTSLKFLFEDFITFIKSFWRVQGTFFQKGSLAAGGKVLAALLLIIVMPFSVYGGTGSAGAPSPGKVRIEHQKLMKKYGLEEKIDAQTKPGQNQEEDTSIDPGYNQENEKREDTSFFEWLKGLSLPAILIIVVVLIVLFYFMFRGAPGFFRRAVEADRGKKEVVPDHEDREEEVRTGDEGYRQALEWAKKRQYGKALIVLHRASVKKLQEYRWIPLGKNYTNNDIRRLIREPGAGGGIHTPFSRLAEAAEGVAFNRENPGEDTFTKLKHVYEAAFLNLPARNRH